MEIACRSLSKSFAHEPVLADVSFTVGDGEFCVVVGPSGGGKTTLLRCIAGLESPDEGEVRLDGVDATGTSVEERNFGFVFQDFEDRLFPHRTVAENVAFGPRHAGVPADEIDRRVDDLLELLAIGETRDDHPPNLSGGQQQRVELARQFARDCDAMLLDDPLSDLDYKLQKRMELELRRIHAEEARTTVYVTHNQDQALALADKVVVLNRGRIEQAAPPSAVYYAPATAFVGRFIGDSNLLVGEPAAAEDGVVEVVTPAGRFSATSDGATASGDTGLVLVRPPDCTIGDAGDRDNRVEGVLRERIYTGDATEFVVSVDAVDEEFQVRRPGQVSLAEVGAGIGERVALGWDAADAVYFDESRYSASDDVTFADLEEV